MIKLTATQEERRIFLNNAICKRCLTDKEAGEKEFLDLLFKYQIQEKTKSELKKYINTLYAANKNIQKSNKNNTELNSYLIDILATESILQNNKNILYTFLNLSYEY